MPIGKLKAKVAGSAEALKKSLKQSGGGGDYLLRVTADSDLDIDILIEPDRWLEYWEHYLDGEGFFPCNDGDCLGCDEGNNPSKRVAIPVVHRDESRVRVMAIPKSVAEQLLAYYDKRNTLLDRSWTITREGSGQSDTKYTVIMGDRYRKADIIALKKYKREMPDVEETVAAQIPKEEDEDDEPPRRSKKGKARKPGGKKATRRRVDADEDDEEDADEDDEDDDDEPDYRPKKRPLAKRKGEVVLGKRKKGKSLARSSR